MRWKNQAGDARGKNMSKKTEKWLERLLPVLLVVILYFVCAGRGGFFYSSNDDSMLTDILSGSYSGKTDAHDIYHIYPLAAVFAVLYKLFPEIPWYGGGLILTQFVCLYLIGYRAIRFAETWKEKLATSALALTFSAVLFLSEIQLIQYTMTSALLAATAIFLLVTEQERSPGIVVILYVYSCLLRFQMGLLLCPFLLTACFYRWVCSEHKKKTFLYYLSVAGAIFGILAICLFVHKIAYRGEDWQAFEEFNQVRTDIYDFGTIPAYDTNEEFYRELSVDRREQFLLEKWSFSLSDKWNTETLNEVNLYQKELGSYQYTYQYLARSLLKVLQQYTFGISSSFGIVLYAMLAVFVLLCIYHKKSWTLLFGSLAFIASHVVCWEYLVWRNRMPERVTNGLYLVEVALLIGMCAQILLRNKEKKQFLRPAMYSVVLVLTIVLFAIKFPVTGDEIEKTAQEAQENTKVQEYCRERGSQFYILDTISFATAKEKIAGGNRPENLTICGAWTVNSPVYVQKLEKYIAADSLQQGLSSGRVSFIVAEDRDVFWLEDYLASLDGNYRLVQKDKVVTQTGNDYLVYDIVSE